MRSERLSDYLEVWGTSDELTIFLDGSVGGGFEIAPLDQAALSDEALNQYAERMTSFLNGLEAGVWIQFVRDIDQARTNQFETHSALAAANANELAKSLAFDRTSALIRQSKIREIREHRAYVFFRVSPPASPKTSFLRGLTRSASQSFSGMLMEQQKLRAGSVRDNICSGLSALGLTPETLPGKDVYELMLSQWNPARKPETAHYDSEDIRSSVVYSDVDIQNSGFSIGAVYHRVISLKLLPDRSSSAMSAALSGLPVGSRVFTSIFVPDQMTEMNALQTQRRLAYSMAFGKRSGVSDLDSNAKFQDLESLLEEMVSRGEKVYHFSLQVLLKGKDEADLDEQINDTLATFRDLAGAEAMVESLAAFEIFSSLAIPNAKCGERVKKIKTTNLSDLIPIYGPWRGHATPRVILKSRELTPVAVDPFDPTLTNANHLISGASGAGKSFLTNILLLQMLKENPLVYFVDIGGSYKRLCENLGGQYVHLTSEGSIAINPFDLSLGEETPSPQKIKFLLGLVEIMTKESHEESLPRLIRAEIEHAIVETYNRSKTPQLSVLKEVLSESPDPKVKMYGRILTQWCGDTAYGKVIDRQTNINLCQNVVAFDLKGMESYPDLQAAFLFIITDLVWREVQRDRGRMKFLVFDECWKLLKNESGLVFIEEVFRTFRKYYASAVAISQDIDDFAKSKIAGALLPNCAFKWLMLQPKGDQTRLKETLALNDNEADLVSSLTQERGHYSEAFLIAAEARTVVVIEAIPLEHWIATTDPRDLTKIDEMKVASPELGHGDILRALSIKYPKGVSNGEARQILI